ncbi:DUF922 domain-containing protein [Algoriphagus chordae]|uniref:DUF922 domain-containing protein n=1 Tax=Algoriphagus chordae TaxID=237019 RepID=A0A2W7RJW7_9BACT|nr:hypothetical protein [Algoriphagus chordae]PZX54809.1 hypothetical protein LV85_01147 [Algoriphagus chordae]
MIRILSSVVLLLAMAIGTQNTFAQKVIVKLQPAEKAPQERNYIFKQVLDSRVDKSIGQIYDPQREKNELSFEEELAQEALAFYKAMVSPSQNISHELEVKIYNLDLKEVFQADRRAYKGELQLSLGFFLLGKQEPVHLVDFNGKLEYSRPATQMHYVESSIQTLFENSWEYFDAWISTQYQSNRSLVKKVKLNILDPTRESSRDTVFYDPAQPLTWDDFRDSPNPLSTFNATIFSSLAIEGNASIEAGEIVQTIKVKVYMLPSQSWVKDANAYANNHEQRHFDLTRIAADRMIARLNATELEPDLFEAKLNDIYLDAYREMNRLQELYDSQTKHGINSGMQSKWNQVITQALAGDWEELDEIIQKD